MASSLLLGGKAGVQIAMANKMAKSGIGATAATAGLQIAELGRQQEEINRISSEQKSDRVRQAEREIGMLRVIAAEQGEGPGLFRQLQELAYFEGKDLSRLEGNRKAQVDSAQSSKVAVKQGAVNEMNQIRNQARTAKIMAGLDAIGAGVQIMSDRAATSKVQEASKNKVS